MKGRRSLGVIPAITLVFILYRYPSLLDQGEIVLSLYLEYGMSNGNDFTDS